MRVLAMSEGSSATLGDVIGGLPGRVAQEYTQPREMIGIQVLLLLTQWR